MFGLFKKKKITLPEVITKRTGIPAIIAETTEAQNFVKNHNNQIILEKGGYYQAFEDFIKLLDDDKIKKSLTNEEIQRVNDYQKAKEHFYKADIAIQNRNFDEAKNEYTHGLSIYPYFFTARLNLAFLLREEGKFEQSLKHYEEGLKLNGPELLYYTNSGRSLLALERKEEAIEAFYKALEIQKDDNYTLEMLEQLGEFIRLYKDHNDPDSVIFIHKDDWENTLFDNFLKAETLNDALKHIYTAVRENRRHLMVRMWNEAQNKLIVDGNKIEDWYLINGFVERTKGNHQKALKIWNEALIKYPQSIGINMNIAKVLKGQEQLDACLHCFRIGDKSEETKVLYFYAYRDIHGISNAINELERLFEEYNDFGFVSITSFELYKDEQIKRAHYLLNFLNETHRENLNIVGQIAGLFGEAGEYKQVIMLTQKYVDDNCKDINIHWNWAYAKFLDGQKDEAIKHLENIYNDPSRSIPDKEFLAKNIKHIRDN